MVVSRMAKEWTQFASPPSYTGGNESNDFNFFKELYLDDIFDSPLGSDLKYYHGKPNLVNDNGVSFKGVVQQVISDNDDSSKKRQVLCSVGTLTSGDYIKYKDDFWIVVGLVDDNKFYEKAIIYYCNWVLKFTLSPDFGSKVTEYPVYCTNSTQYNSGVKNAINTKFGSAQYLVYIQSNDETNMVERDTRFLIDKNNLRPTAYRITQVDETSKSFNSKGVNIWTIMECQTEYMNDDVHNGIANKVKQEVVSDSYKNHNISTNNQNLLDEWA